MSLFKFSLKIALWVTRVFTAVVILFDVYVLAKLAAIYAKGGIPAVKAYIRPDRLTGTVDAAGEGHFVIASPAHPYMEFTIMTLTLVVLTIFLPRVWKLLARSVSKPTNSP